MIKKMLLVSVLMFALSGCTIEYNVNINEDMAIEEIIVNDYYVETFPVPAYINEQGASETNSIIENVDYYNINYQNNNTYFNFTFPIENYDMSTAVNICLKSFKKDYDNAGNYFINTSGYNSCFDLYPLIDEIIVNITLDSSDYFLVDNNADFKHNGTLVWNITRDNYQDKNIQVIYNKTNADESNDSNSVQEAPTQEEESNTLSSKQTNLIIIGAISIFVIIFVVVIVVKKKRL